MLSSEERGARKETLPAMLRGFSAKFKRKTILTEASKSFLSVLLEAGVSEEELVPHCNSGQMDYLSLEAAFLDRVGQLKWLQGLAIYHQVESYDLKEADISAQVALIVPQDVAAHYKVACIAIDEDGTTLAMVDPGDEFAVAQVEEKTDFKVFRRLVVTNAAMVDFQEMLYGTPRSLHFSPRSIVDDIIKQAITFGASDIHIEPMEDDIQVRFRKDGILIQSFDLGKVATKKIILRHLKSALPVVIKNKSGACGKTMNIAENQRPQDGRIYLPTRRIDMRISVLPAIHGESIVIRIHRPDEEETGLQHLGFSGTTLDRFQSIIGSPYGILLVSGPTGSGKTTTLYTVLRLLNSPEKKILTIEDPVEYGIPGIIQIQTNAAKGLTFASALRSFLRHDPDTIMIGEIRDSETALMAMEASLTGHLVLSTIHANDAVRTLTRMKDLGVNAPIITSACLGTLAQRLVRTICRYCMEPARFSKRFYQLLEDYEIEFNDQDLLQGKGCPQCNLTGYRGRTGIHELMVMTPEIRELILRHAADSEIEGMARSQGMKFLLEDALLKAVQGLTTEAEVLRVTMAETRSPQPSAEPRRHSKKGRRHQPLAPEPEPLAAPESAPKLRRDKTSDPIRPARPDAGAAPSAPPRVTPAPSNQPTFVLYKRRNIERRRCQSRLLAREPVEMTNRTLAKEPTHSSSK